MNPGGLCSSCHDFCESIHYDSELGRICSDCIRKKASQYVSNEEEEE
jgi:hypothetical protein